MWQNFSKEAHHSSNLCCKISKSGSHDEEKKAQWSPILCGSNYGQLIAHLKTKKLSIQLLKLLSAYHTNTTSSANLVENLLKVTSVRDYIEKVNTVVGN